MQLCDVAIFDALIFRPIDREFCVTFTAVVSFFLFKHQRQRASATYMPVKSITMQLVVVVK